MDWNQLRMSSLRATKQRSGLCSANQATGGEMDYVGESVLAVQAPTGEDEHSHPKMNQRYEFDSTTSYVEKR